MNYKNNLKSFSKMLIVTFAIVSLVGGTSPFGLVSVAEAGNRGNSSPQKTQSQKKVSSPKKIYKTEKSEKVKKPEFKKTGPKVSDEGHHRGGGGKGKGDGESTQTPPVATSTSVTLCKEDSEGNQLND